MNNDLYRVPGLYHRTLTLTLEGLNKHRKLIPLFQRSMENSMSDDLTDPLTYKLIMSLDPICRIPCICLSLLGLRWSDLQSLTVDHLKIKKRISLIQSKTGQTKSINNKYIFTVLSPQTFDPSIPLVCCTYEHVRKDIQDKRRFASIRIPKACNDATHIFRHLTASWLYHKDFSVMEISKKLGHLNKESTLKYVHNWDEIHISNKT